MSLVLNLVDCTATGALGSAWTASGGTFTQDGQRVYAVTPATHSQAYLTTAPNLSASTPVKVRYEVDVTMPATFPATGLVRLGLACFNGPLVCVYERTSGGAATRLQFLIRHQTTGTETSLFTSPVTAIAAGATARVRFEVTDYQTLGLAVQSFISYDGGVTFSGPHTVSTPNVPVWNSATGQSVTSMASVSKTAGIVASVAGLPGYLDNLRITDIGNLATTQSITTAPTLTVFPTLAAITVGAEDDGTVATLTVQPSYAMQVADEWEIVESPYDGGYKATTARQTRRRRNWRFHWDAMDATDVTAFGVLRAAVASRKSAFTWTENVTGETLRISFAEDPRVSLVASGVWQADALVREVLS